MAICSAQLGLLHRNADIAETFRVFYLDLYNLRHSCGAPVSTEKISKLSEYLKRTKLPSIDSLDLEDLDSPFTDEELMDTIKNLASGKAPGPDGYTTSFYKTLRKVLIQPMLKAFNSITSSSVFPPQALEAHITVLLKPGKDTNNPGGYRPISLLNCEVKFFSKMMATRLQQILPSLIHTDQVGFVQGREACDNTIKTLLLMTHAKNTKTPPMPSFG